MTEPVVVSPRRMCVTEVVRNDVLCREHVRLERRAVGFPSSEPGQFV